MLQSSATSTFLPAVQNIAATATYSATLTPIGGDTVIGSVALSGTVDEQVIGRTSNTETGSFLTEITGLDLSGPLVLPPGNPFDGATLTVTLGTPTSSGTATITPDGNGFVITGRGAGALDLGDAADRLRRPWLRRPTPQPSPDRGR